MSMIIGLTGPTGAGKSSASAAAKSLGFRVIDCDKIARQATKPKSEGLMALCDVFGTDILNADGTLDRKALAARAFSTPENTALLNQTILPFIVKMIKAEIRGNTLLDAPTLFESGIQGICTKTVAVLAEREVRLARIIARDGLTLNEANTRINAGQSDTFYKQNADYILYNNGDEDAFLKRFSEVIKEIAGGSL